MFSGDGLGIETKKRGFVFNLGFTQFGFGLICRFWCM